MKYILTLAVLLSPAAGCQTGRTDNPADTPPPFHPGERNASHPDNEHDRPNATLPGYPRQ